jgi:hypothetical protein
LTTVGAMQMLYAQQGADFYSGDTTYLELARSLLNHRSYGFDFRPETMLPPGFPALLAGLIAVLGDSHAVLVRTMVVFATLGLVLTYILLKRQQSRSAAAAICLVIASSPVWFRFASTIVFSDMPYFCLSMALLLSATKLDVATERRSIFKWGAISAFLLVASMLMRSSGVALLGGLVAWIAVSLASSTSLARNRLKKFAVPILFGVCTQIAWSAWSKPRETIEWPIGGYPKPYLAQLAVKSGNEPDLGPMSVRDVPELVGRNLADYTSAIDYLVTRKGTFEQRWFLPWTVGTIVLALIGLGASITSSGGTLSEWYILIYQAIFVIWPWDFEFRFVLPIAPLICMYIWRGCAICVKWIVEERRPAAVVVPIVSGLLAAVSALNAASTPHPQAFLATTVWTLVTLLTSGVIWLDGGFFSKLLRSGRSQPALVVACLVLIFLGTTRCIAVARENESFEVAHESGYPQMVAASWLREHAPRNAVIMARQLDVVYHYSRLKVVWFPPTLDAEMLMGGIARHGVDFIVVLDRGAETYWRPGEDRSFARLLDKYPDRFALVQQGSREKIYAVVCDVAEEGCNY